MSAKTITIENRKIGPGYPALIIAEAGVNHNGDYHVARKMVTEAKNCGADCIKFQTFRAEEIVTRDSPKAPYQLKTTSPRESQLDMLHKLELSERRQEELMGLCKENGLIFLSTPCTPSDVDFLDRAGVSAFKVASSQAVDTIFLEHMARKGKPILLSTGMCTLAEVDEAVRAIREAGNDQIIVLQCTTNYPSRLEDANLRAMVAMGRALDVLTGYSDHTPSLAPSVVAVGLGACVIERHFTLDKKLPGPDQLSSSEPREFSQLTAMIREAEKSLGSGIKAPSSEEMKNAAVMRRSIVARRDIAEGEILTLDNLCVKRPEIGLPSSFLKFVLGKKARQHIPNETFVDIEMIQ